MNLHRTTNVHVCGFMHNLQNKKIDTEFWVSKFAVAQWNAVENNSKVFQPFKFIKKGWKMFAPTHRKLKILINNESCGWEDERREKAANDPKFILIIFLFICIIIRLLLLIRTDLNLIKRILWIT